MHVVLGSQVIEKAPFDPVACCCQGRDKDMPLL